MAEKVRVALLGIVGTSILIVAFGLGFGLSSADKKQDSLIVYTKTGPIQGIRYDKEDARTWSNYTKFDPSKEYRSTIFLGVPYAQAPGNCTVFNQTGGLRCIDYAVRFILSYIVHILNTIYLQSGKIGSKVQSHCLEQIRFILRMNFLPNARRRAFKQAVMQFKVRIAFTSMFLYQPVKRRSYR